MSTYDFPVCTECNVGHYRWRATETLTCAHCGHTVEWSDFTEPVFYNPQWDVMVTTPQRAVDVMTEVKRELGIELTVWHTGGGCVALGATLPDGREMMVTDADANLPGRYDDELFGGVFDPSAPEDGEHLAYHGHDLDELVDRLRTLLGSSDG